MNIIVRFFISVSSLKVFGHSIHSERSRIYLGDQCMPFKMTPLSYHDYSVSGSSGQQCSGIPLKLLCLFSSILVHHKKFFCKVSYQYRSHMTFSNKIQAKTPTWPDMSFLCSICYIDVPNKGIEQACSWASCDIHISPLSINVHFSL